MIDCAAIGDVFAQSAIALRARVPRGVCAALAEVGAREAAISLAVNPGADLPEFSMRRMIERFGDDGEMREALLSRPYLPARCAAISSTPPPQASPSFVVDCGWLSSERAERLAREARDKANVIIVAETAECDGRHGVRELVAHLRGCGQLTASLVLRALLSGNRDLFEAALVELSGLREDKVAGSCAISAAPASRRSMRARPAGKISARLPRRAGGATRIWQASAAGGEARLSLVMIERVLTACEEINDGELDKLMALLRRFEMEAAREEAREATSRTFSRSRGTDDRRVVLCGASRIDLAALEDDMIVCEAALMREAAFQ